MSTALNMEVDPQEIIEAVKKMKKRIGKNSSKIFSQPPARNILPASGRPEPNIKPVGPPAMKMFLANELPACLHPAGHQRYSETGAEREIPHRQGPASI